MDEIYQWIYDHYALPELEKLETGHDNILLALSERLSLSQRQRRRLLDTLENMRIQWGTESFALGVRFGMDLAAPHVLPDNCEWLADFLP